LDVAVAGGVKLDSERLVALHFFTEDFEVGDFHAEERLFRAVFYPEALRGLVPLAASSDLAWARVMGRSDFLSPR
jgi:hypothetical protein